MSGTRYARRGVFRRVYNVLDWLLLLLLTLFLFLPTRAVNFNGDGVWYMDHALNVAHGLGWVDVDQSTVLANRLVFPAYMGLIYRLFGATEMTTFVALRLFFVLNTLLVYALGKRLFGKPGGFLAALLVLSSFSLNEWQTIINLDYMLAFVMLGAIALMVRAFEREGWRWFVAAGVAMALGYFTKEIAVVLLPMPLLMWALVPEYRTRKQLIRALLATGLGVGLVGIWVLYTRLAGVQGGTQGVGSVLITTSQFGSNLPSGRLLADLLQAPWHYYQSHLVPYFFYAPLFVLAWLFVIYQAIRGKNRQPYQILLAIFLPFLPQIVYLGWQGFRPGQSFAFFLLSYIALAAFFVALARVLQRAVSGLRPTTVWQWGGRAMAVSLLVLVIGVQALERDTVWTAMPKLKSGTYGNMIDHSRRFNTIDYFRQGRPQWKTVLDSYKPAAQWMSGNISTGAAIMAPLEATRKLYWLTGARYPFYFLHEAAGWTSLYVLGQPSSDLQKGHFVYLVVDISSVDAANGLRGKRVVWRAFSEDAFLNDVRSKEIAYLALTSRMGYMLPYLMAHPAFVLVGDFDRVWVFKVLRDHLEPSAQPIRFVGSSYRIVQELVRANSELFTKLQTDVLGSALGLSPEAAQAVVTGQAPQIPLRYTLDAYLKDFEGRPPDDLKTLVDEYEAEAALMPDNPWPYIVIGALYRRLGDAQAAAAAYDKAVSRPVSDPGGQKRLSGIFLNQALALQRAGDYAGALQALTKVAVAAAGGASLRETLLAMDSTTLEQYAQAGLQSEMKVLFQKWARQQPDDMEVQMKTAQTYADLGDVEQAASFYRQIVTRWPDSLSAYYQLGRLYENHGLVQKAIPVYRQAVMVWSGRKVNVSSLEMGRIYLELAKDP
ncbi:MAG: tetratricopeptide repeat protein [Chloroflexi bacterium]|nr:tetratricopeptide repeat protein [Chloroflexota bacterium]